MTGNRVTIPKALVLERRRKIWKLRQRGFTYEQIAEQVGISANGVSKALNVITKKYTERHLEDVDRIKAEQIASLELVASEAFRAWEISKEKSKLVRIKNTTRNGQETTQEARDSAGDPRYLITFLKAKQEIREIIGADAPKKIDVKYADLANLSDDELIKQAQQALIEIQAKSPHGNDIEGEVVRDESESVETASGSTNAGLL